MTDSHHVPLPLSVPSRPSQAEQRSRTWPWAKLLRWIVLIGLLAPDWENGRDTVAAQMACAYYSVSQPLTDLGPNEYYRLTSLNPPTFRATGEIGGLYPGGTNERPAAHTAAGVALASQIQPLAANGEPAPSGKIGLASVGMSNTSSEFDRFRSMANADPQVHDQLVLVNGAAGGGVIERWVDPQHPQYNTYWNYFNTQMANAGLSPAQIQVVWAKVTNQGYKANFPADMRTLAGQFELLARELKSRLPNLKLTYFSSRTRAFAYFAGPAEPTAFENAFAVRWLLEKQINGDPGLNFDPSLGATPVSYLSWGPYLWIDGLNPRSDGRTWPLSNVVSTDCVHPTAAGNQAVADMLMEFFKSDPTTTGWFLNPGVPTLTPVPTLTMGPTPTRTLTPTRTPTLPATVTASPTLTRTPTGTRTATSTTTPTRTVTQTATPSATRTVTSTPTQGYTAVPTSSPTPTTSRTPTLTPTLLPPTSPISWWGFGSDLVTDDINGCVGCSNTSAAWFAPSLVSGGYAFNGASSALNLGTFPYLNSRSAFTVAAWVRPGFDHSHSTWRYVLSDGSNIQLFYLSNINDWRASIRTTSGTYRLDTSGLTWSANTWHLLALTFDGASAKLYWDGNLASSLAVSGAVAADSGATYLGRASSAGNHFLGDIDELRVYSYALSAAELLALFLSP